MSIKGALKKSANGLLSWFDLQIVRRSQFEGINQTLLPLEACPALAPDAVDFLQPSNPALQSLRLRYASHPASVHSQWSSDFISQHVDLQNFRADNAYVWQGPRFSESNYLMTAYYAKTADRLGIFDRLEEDGRFGAPAFRFNGKVVSRDLLDSVMEINFLQECFGTRKFSLLDIGAGYGRLAHRLSEAMPTANPIFCTDAVPESSFVCDYYLKFRRARAQTVPLDEVESLVERETIDIATNIHSFSECTTASIRWWLSLLHDAQIQYLWIVPNRSQKLFSSEVNGERIECSGLLADFGYKLRLSRPKYGTATAMERYGIGPTWYLLFELTK